MANDVNLGRVQAKARGQFGKAVQYQILDFVHLNGIGYQCIKDSIGNEVTNTEYFTEFVKSGIDGKDGATISVNGVSEVNGNVDITADNLDTTPPPDYPDWINAQEYMRGLKLMIENETDSADKVATRYVTTVANATGSSQTSIEGQADYITEHKKTASKNFFTKGIVYDEQDNLATLSEKILDLESEFTGVNKSTDEMAVYGENINKGDLIKLQNSYDFTNTNRIDVMPYYNCRNCICSPDGKYLAVTSDFAPYLYIYNISFDAEGNEILRYLPNTVFNFSIGNDVGLCFSPDSRFLYVGHNGNPFITIYQLIDGDFVLSGNLPETPKSVVNRTACFGDVRVFCSNLVVKIYRQVSDLVYEDITLNMDIPMNTSLRSVRFSDDGKLLFFSSAVAPFLHIYKVNYDILNMLPTDEYIFTKLPTPELTVSIYDSILVNDTLICCLSSPPYVFMYTKKEDDTFEKIAVTMDTVPNEPTYYITKGKNHICLCGGNGWVYPLTLDTLSRKVNMSVANVQATSSMTNHNNVDYIKSVSPETPYLRTFRTDRLEKDILPIHQGEIEKRAIQNVKISNNDKYIAIAYSGVPQKIGIFDGISYEHIVDITGYAGVVVDLDFKYDSNYIAFTTTLTPWLYVYKINEDKTVTELTITGAKGSSMNGVKFSLQGHPNGDHLMVLAATVLYFYSVVGDVISYSYELNTSSSAYNTMSLSPNNKYISLCSSTAGQVGNILEYNISTKKYEVKLKTSGVSLRSVFSKAGVLFCMNNTGGLDMFDWGKGTFAKIPGEIKAIALQSTSYSHDLQLSNDDSTIICCCFYSSPIGKYNISVVQIQDSTSTLDDSFVIHGEKLKGFGSTVEKLAFFNNSNKVITVSLQYPYVAIYDRDTQIAKPFDGDFSNKDELQYINNVGVAKYDGLKRETKEVAVF